MVRKYRDYLILPTLIQRVKADGGMLLVKAFIHIFIQFRKHDRFSLVIAHYGVRAKSVCIIQNEHDGREDKDGTEKKSNANHTCRENIGCGFLNHRLS